MINLEQVKLLELKVAKAIDYIERMTAENAATADLVKRITAENAALQQREAELQARMESYQKRIDDFEILIMRFKEDQGQIEDGILSVLDKLSQFEEAMEKSLNEGKGKSGETAPPKTQKAAAAKTPEPNAGSVEEICFEIPENPPQNDIGDPLTGEELPVENKELDIF
jgi:TolA-binding protein